MSEGVPFRALAPELTAMAPELAEAFGRVVASGRLLDGPCLRALERALADRCGVVEAVGVGSGTQALQALLHAHDIGPGDEVITTAASFYATAKAITLVGATPRFADVRREDYNLDPECASALVTERTRAILAVHLYGRPAPMGDLQALADRAGVLLLEDAAHALGAGVNGHPVGSLADGAALSFYPTKNLGALGDAGAVLANDVAVAARARAARFLGSSGRRDEFDRPGFSGRMDEIQAAALRVRLKHFDRLQERRAELAARYRSALPTSMQLPVAPVGVEEAHHLFVVRCANRDRIATALGGIGIETQVHYRVPLHRQQLFRTRTELPVAERWATEVLSLPFGPNLTLDQQDRVTGALNQLQRSNGDA